MANATQAIRAAAGIVMIHAAMMLAPRAQRTADSLRAAPTPMTEPVITWVVLTGSPMRVAPWITLAPINCAENAVAGSSFKLLHPSVRMIRHPPAYVPNAIVAADSTTTQRGTWNLGRSPDATNASVIAAMVFWASLAPCE